MSESSSYAGAGPDAPSESYNAYAAAAAAAGQPVYGYDSPQYSGMLAEQRQQADDDFRRSPAGQEWQRQQDLGTQRKAQRDSKGTFTIIAGIVAAVAVVLTAGTALGFFGPAVAAAEGAAIGAGAGGLEGAVAAALAEGAIEAGAATAALAEAAPAVAAVETGVSAAAGGAAGAAEAAAPSIFSSIIDGATSVYNAISGVVESVGAFTDISSPLTIAAKDAGINPLVAKLGSTSLVGAGRGALTSGIQGGDIGLGALGGAVGGLVSAGSRELLTAAGLGKEGFEAGIKGTLSSALGGGASGAARAAAGGGDVGAAALRGLATGGASGAANYLLSDALGLGGQIGSLGGTLASNFVGSALAPDTPTPTARSREVIRVPRPRAPAPDAPDTPSPSGPSGGGPTNFAGLFDLGGGSTGGGGRTGGGGTGVSAGGTGISGVYGTTGATGGSGVTTSGTPSTISTSSLASLLSSPSDPGYSSPLSDNTEPSSSQPSPWNRSSLRTTDPLGSSYG